MMTEYIKSTFFLISLSIVCSCSNGYTVRGKIAGEIASCRQVQASFGMGTTVENGAFTLSLNLFLPDRLVVSKNL